MKPETIQELHDSEILDNANAEIERLEKLSARVITLEDDEYPPLLRGEDVMTRFSLAPGPAVGALLSRAREAQALGLVRTRDEALGYLDSSGDDP